MMSQDQKSSEGQPTPVRSEAKAVSSTSKLGMGAQVGVGMAILTGFYAFAVVFLNSAAGSGERKGGGTEIVLAIDQMAEAIRVAGGAGAVGFENVDMDTFESNFWQMCLRRRLLPVDVRNEVLPEGLLIVSTVNMGQSDEIARARGRAVLGKATSTFVLLSRVKPRLAD